MGTTLGSRHATISRIISCAPCDAWECTGPITRLRRLTPRTHGLGATGPPAQPGLGVRAPLAEGPPASSLPAAAQPPTPAQALTWCMLGRSA
jgi:hypothetical protein